MAQDTLDLVLALHIADEELSGIVDDGTGRSLQFCRMISISHSSDLAIRLLFTNTEHTTRKLSNTVLPHRTAPFLAVFVHTQEHVRDLIDLFQMREKIRCSADSRIIGIGERIFGIHRHLRERDQIEGATRREHLRDISSPKNRRAIGSLRREIQAGASLGSLFMTSTNLRIVIRVIFPLLIASLSSIYASSTASDLFLLWIDGTHQGDIILGRCQCIQGESDVIGRHRNIPFGQDDLR